ncbi:Uncharacterised protein [Serratia fonticola]|uniref:hypothetical protein n=1 Tax=Serratia fonticola TaxID=47917 RepID=UPI002179CDCF|nr:hypothetical protein [Serratia fonticola]CAI1772771.1 Uncharacterised protein [Serratia fonticola]
MAVVRRFSPFLENKLNQLYHQGYVEFERWELLSWFQKDRITKAVWTEIISIWDEWFDEPVPLRMIQVDESSTPQKYLILRQDRIIEASDKL